MVRLGHATMMSALDEKLGAREHHALMRAVDLLQRPIHVRVLPPVMDWGEGVRAMRGTDAHEREPRRSQGMSIEHQLHAPVGSEVDSLMLWWLGVRKAANPARHYAVMHSPRCTVARCGCVPAVVRVPGGLQ